MRTKVDSVAIAEIAHHQQSALRHRGRAVAAVLAAVLLSACSSRNPDSLIGMNVDENLAMTNASETPDANLAGADISGAANAPADTRFSNQTTRPATKESVPRASGTKPADVNTADSVVTNRPTEDESTDQASDEPNST